MTARLATARRVVAQALAGAFLAGDFLAGDWTPAAMADRGGKALGQRPSPWLADLARAARHAYPEPPRDRPRELAHFLDGRPPLREAFARSLADGGPPLGARRWTPTATAMGVDIAVVLNRSRRPLRRP
ncbi:MAG: hypothetical protein ACRD1K_02825 [Acidimicrobiales bacterium]